MTACCSPRSSETFSKCSGHCVRHRRTATCRPFSGAAAWLTRAIDALRDLTSPRALVVREGQPQRIASRDVVRGDLPQLKEGDRVPADAWLLEADGVRVDESLLTGEGRAGDQNFLGRRCAVSWPGRKNSGARRW